MSSWLVDFTVEALAGVVGVFVGVLLALIVDRRLDSYRHTQGRFSPTPPRAQPVVPSGLV